MTHVQLIRSTDLPANVNATYEQVGDQITVLIRRDLITDEGAHVVADLCSTALTKHWRPVSRLHLIDGGGAPQRKAT